MHDLTKDLFQLGTLIFFGVTLAYFAWGYWWHEKRKATMDCVKQFIRTRRSRFQQYRTVRKAHSQTRRAWCLKSRQTKPKAASPRS